LAGLDGITGVLGICIMLNFFSRLNNDLLQCDVGGVDSFCVINGDFLPSADSLFVQALRLDLSAYKRPLLPPACSASLEISILID
jgi:hypothetical protein